MLKSGIQTKNAQQVLNVYLQAKAYIEFYTVDDYFVQQSQICETTEKHIHILQRKPKIVSSLSNTAQTLEITKIMPIAKDERDKKRLTIIFESLKNKLTLSWALHPVALPLQFGIITAANISKKQGAIEISKSLKVPLKNILGIGDSQSDWQFIELCGYGAAMGNAAKELKNLVLSKGKRHSYIGPSVDENGILEILKYFIH
jgi:hydroxymethylpyrimidine pyrophosphatase-like HAD family hydrolase